MSNPFAVLADTGQAQVSRDQTDERTTEQQGFSAIAGDAVLSISKSYPQSFPTRRVQHLAIADGKYVYATAANQVRLGNVAHLREALDNLKQSKVNGAYEGETQLQVEATISHVAFSADASKFFVAATDGGLLTYATASPQNGRQESQIPAIVDLLPNPTDNSLALLTADGQLIILTNNVTKVIAREVSAISWSKKGKQILAGSYAGVLQQYTPDGTLKDTLSPPEASVGAVNAVNWLENNLFAVTYMDSENELSVYLLRRSTSNNQTSLAFTLLTNPSLSFGDTSHPPCYSLLPLSKSLILTTSTTSADIGLISIPHNCSLTNDDDLAKATLRFSPERDTEVSITGLALERNTITREVTVWTTDNDGGCGAWTVRDDENSLFEEGDKATSAKVVNSSPFAVSNQTGSGVFGASNSSGPASSAFTNSPFGQANVSKPTSMFGTSAFGATNMMGTGEAASSGNSKPAFGATSQFSQPAAFGAPAFGSASAFGSSTFGASSNSTTTPFAGFGQNSPFNNTSNTSAFGAVSTGTGGSSPFAGTAPSKGFSSQAPLFGSGGGSSTSAFGSGAFGTTQLNSSNNKIGTSSMNDDSDDDAMEGDKLADLDNKEPSSTMAENPFASAGSAFSINSQSSTQTKSSGFGAQISAFGSASTPAQSAFGIAQSGASKSPAFDFVQAQAKTSSPFDKTSSSTPKPFGSPFSFPTATAGGFGFASSSAQGSATKSSPFGGLEKTSSTETASSGTPASLGFPPVQDTDVSDKSKPSLFGNSSLFGSASGEASTTKTDKANLSKIPVPSTPATSKLSFGFGSQATKASATSSGFGFGGNTSFGFAQKPTEAFGSQSTEFSKLATPSAGDDKPATTSIVERNLAETAPLPPGPVPVKKSEADVSLSPDLSTITTKPEDDAPLPPDPVSASDNVVDDAPLPPDPVPTTEVENDAPLPPDPNSMPPHSLGDAPLPPDPTAAAPGAVAHITTDLETKDSPASVPNSPLDLSPEIRKSAFQLQSTRERPASDINPRAETAKQSSDDSYDEVEDELRSSDSLNDLNRDNSQELPSASNEEAFTKFSDDEAGDLSENDEDSAPPEDDDGGDDEATEGETSSLADSQDEDDDRSDVRDSEFEDTDAVSDEDSVEADAYHSAFAPKTPAFASATMQNGPTTKSSPFAPVTLGSPFGAFASSPASEKKQSAVFDFAAQAKKSDQPKSTFSFSPVPAAEEAAKAEKTTTPDPPTNFSGGWSMPKSDKAEQTQSPFDFKQQTKAPIAILDAKSDSSNKAPEAATIDTTKDTVQTLKSSSERSSNESDIGFQKTTKTIASEIVPKNQEAQSDEEVVPEIVTLPPYVSLDKAVAPESIQKGLTRELDLLVQQVTNGLVIIRDNLVNLSEYMSKIRETPECIDNATETSDEAKKAYVTTSAYNDTAQKMTADLASLKSAMIVLESQKVKIQRLLRAQTDSSFAQSLRMSALGPEYASQQRELRRQMANIEKDLAKFQSSLTLIKTKLASEQNVATPVIAPENITMAVSKIMRVAAQKEHEVDDLQRRFVSLQMTTPDSTMRASTSSRSHRKRPSQISQSVDLSMDLSLTNLSLDQSIYGGASGTNGRRATPRAPRQSVEGKQHLMRVYSEALSRGKPLKTFPA